MRQQDIDSVSYVKAPSVKEMERLAAIIPRQAIIDAFGAMKRPSAKHFQEEVAAFVAPYRVSPHDAEPYVFAVVQEYWQSLPDDFWEDRT